MSRNSEQSGILWALIKAEIERSLQLTTFRVGFADAEPETSGHAIVHVVPVAPSQSLHLPGGIEWIRDDLS